MVKFEKIKSVKKHLKICVYGATGTGKTYFALGFEKALIIDLEAGSDLYAERFPDTLIYKTKSFNDVVLGVSEIENTLPKLNIQTLIIDPVTILWNQLLDSKLEAKKLKFMRANGKANLDSIDLTFSDWGDIKRKYNTLLTRLCNLDVNVILIGRIKDEYEIKNVNGHMELTKIGVKMNAEKDTPYTLDILFRLECEKDGRRFAIFEKDRSGTFPTGFRLENPSFKDFKGILDKHNKGEVASKQSIDEEESSKDAQTELTREAKLQEMFDWFNNCTTTLELKTITEEIEKNKAIFTSADLELLRQEYVRKHKELTTNKNLISAGNNGGK